MSYQHHLFLKPQVDRATYLGTLAAFGLVFIAMCLGGSIGAFFDFKSFLIVVGGTLGATLITFPIDDFKKTLAVLRAAFFPDAFSAEHRIRKIIDIAHRARVNGVLSLQTDLYREPDPFLKKCLELLVDDLKANDIRRILEIDISFLGDRHRRGAQIFQTMGSIAPAVGLIGTLIGLVQMLGHLETPEAIGPSMSLALLTTFYGAVLANLVFLPLAGKLRARSEEETLLKQMTIEGIMCLLENTNPRLIEQRLMGFLSPEKRFSQFN